jgi:hypothetical protein
VITANNIGRPPADLCTSVLEFNVSTTGGTSLEIDLFNLESLGRVAGDFFRDAGIAQMIWSNVRYSRDE